MRYRSQIFGVKKKKRHPFSLSFRIFKIFIYVFLLVSTLWGCGLMFTSKFNSYQVTDITGQNVYRPGVFFEIIIDTLLGKNHYFHMVNNQIHEYGYLAISSWQEAFTKTQSPFYGCFVYPIAWVLIKILDGLGGIANGGAILGAIFLTSLILRLLTLSFGLKMQLNQEKMQTLQLKQAEITAKYKNSSDPLAKRKQQMEILALYRKEKMSPFSVLGVYLLSIPFLIAMYTVVKSVRKLRIAHIGQVYLIDQPWNMITHGHPIYLLLLGTYLPLQILSMFLPTILAARQQKIVTAEQKKARKKQLLIQGAISITFFIVAITVAAGVALYWIFSAAIQIAQVLIIHWLRYYNKKTSPQKTWIKAKIAAASTFLTGWNAKLITAFKPKPAREAAAIKRMLAQEHQKIDYAPLKRAKSKRKKTKLLVGQKQQKEAPTIALPGANKTYALKQKHNRGKKSKK